MSQNNNNYDEVEISKLLNDTDFIYKIGKPSSSVSEKLQLLILKLLIILWEHDEIEKIEDIEIMDEKLQIIDDVRHELSFLRAKYYKEIFTRKTRLVF